METDGRASARGIIGKPVLRPRRGPWTQLFATEILKGMVRTMSHFFHNVRQAMRDQRPDPVLESLDRAQKVARIESTTSCVEDRFGLRALGPAPISCPSDSRNNRRVPMPWAQVRAKFT